MTTPKNTETYDMMEMVFYLYATSDDVPESPLDQEKFLEHAVTTATKFVRYWKDAGLPEQRMLDSFRNDIIRSCILIDIPQHIPFTEQVLDRLDKSWKQRESLSPQRQILRHCEERHKQYQQAKWNEQ